VPDPEIERKRQRTILQGELPSPLNPPPGCVFSTRCPIRIDTCSEAMPPLRRLSNGRGVACIRVGE
jgi:oligopeptide transport system ATP-binding protein